MKNGKVILGVLAGAATGAILGILFAPDKGVKTRKKIAKRSRKYVDDVGQSFNSIIDEMSSKLKNAANNGKSAVEELVEDSTPASNKKTRS
jgi:gas vesicle protein